MPRPSRVLPLLSPLLLTAAAAAQTRPAAESLACEKYVLPNGLTVVLHVDRTLPVACINLWYQVGARNEPPHRSGFAHLFEHLMFMGTRRAAGSAFDDLMEAAGGSNNADTSLDRTDYYSAGPSSSLPLLLWLDADRLDELGRQMVLPKLKLQRDVVRNEIRQQVENRPYGRAYEQSFGLLYPPGHPYHNGVYGTHEDLEAATVNDVKDFFATFYAPDNCALVVAGNFEPAAIKPLVARLYGSIPRGKPAVVPPPPPVHLDRVVRSTMFDKVQLPRLEFDYHSPATFADGDAETSLLAGILAGGKDSRLYRRLVVLDQSAVDVSATQDGAALGSILRISVDAKPEADLSAVEAAVDEELAKLAEQGPTEAEVRRRAMTTELDLLRSMQDVRSRARSLNEYQAYWGDPDSLHRDLQRFRTADAAGVRRWAKTVLTPDGRLITRVLPEHPAMATAALEQQPAPLPASPFTAPLPQVVTLSNGIPVYVYERHELPIVACQVTVDPGTELEPPARAGLASLAAAMTQEGAGPLDSTGFAQAISGLGGTIRASADDRSVELSAQVLSRNFAPAAGLLGDALLRPRMDGTDFARVKATRLDELQQRADVPNAVAGDVGRRMLYADASRLGLPPVGTAATVGSLSLDDVRDGYRDLLARSAVRIVVAGDVTPEQARAALDGAFGAWHGSAAPATATAPADSPVRPSTAMRVYLVDRPGAVQTVISLLAPAMPFADKGRVDAELVNVALGGSFTSRLNRNLRETHGYTYGARSGYALRRDLGTFSAGASVRADVTGPALTEFLGELRRLPKSDLTDAECRKARETYRTSTTERFGTVDGLVDDAGYLLSVAAPFDARTEQLTRAAAATPAALNAAAANLLHLDRSVLVLVGDKRIVLEQMKGVDLPAAVVVNPQGVPVP